jgi:hypothetical protein
VAVRIEPARSSDRPAARLDVGASVVQRTFSFQSNAAANKPQDTSLSAAAGLRIEAELYPLALSRPDSKLANLGLAGDYDHTFGLSVTPKSMATASAPVSQSSYSIGLRYRFVFGQTETSPSLTLGVGYGKRLFSTDTSNVTDPVALQAIRRDTPATEYTAIDPGASFRLPITRMIAVSLGGRGLLITNAGPIQNAASYGKAKIYGAEAGAAVDIVLGGRFALRFAGEYTQVGFTFMGGGQLSNGLDQNLTTQEVGGLADREIGGSATFGVVY